MSVFSNATVLAAIIAAVASLLIALVNFFTTRRNQHQLEALQAEIREKEAEKDARRDYEYEARKRLYQQYEPLLFQLVEFSENALWRIQGLAREARSGYLNPNSGGWLSESMSNGYYFMSTIYRLISPLVYVKLIQRSLTLVDLTVDPNLKNQYILAKWLYTSFTDDFKFATIDPKLQYDPNCADWKEKRIVSPEKYWRQGFTLGMLDNAVEALIVSEPNGVLRCMSYGEFVNTYNDQAKNKKFRGFIDVFLEFHPRERPVLWRMLITQVYIYQALMQARESKMSSATTSITPKLLKPVPKENLIWYDWRQGPNEEIDKEVFVVPFTVGQVYLQKNLGSLCDFDI